MAIIKGPASWAKILGNPRPNKFNPANPEWSIEVGVDDETFRQLRKDGLGARVKNKDDERGDFISFRRKLYNFKGETNDPIKVVDADGNEWPKNKLIGNGSIVLIRYNVRKNEQTGQNNAYIQAVKVLEHVPYEADDFAGWGDDTGGDTEADRVGRTTKAVRGKQSAMWDDDEDEGEAEKPKRGRKTAAPDLDDDIDDIA